MTNELPFHYNCRCVMVPLLPVEKSEALSALPGEDVIEQAEQVVNEYESKQVKSKRPK